MRRGDLYLVEKATRTDTKKQRVFVVVSRQPLVDSAYSTVVCAPVYSVSEGISTQVPVGIEEGLKHQSCIRCDELVSIKKSDLTNFIGHLSEQKLEELKEAIRIALAVE